MFINNKISMGIVVFGFLAIFYFCAMLYLVVSRQFGAHSIDMIFVSYCIAAVGGLVFGVGVLKRLAWARVGLIFLAVVFIVDIFEYFAWMFSEIKNYDAILLAKLIVHVILLVSAIIFFTRPKVKQQFTKYQITKHEKV